MCNFYGNKLSLTSSNKNDMNHSDHFFLFLGKTTRYSTTKVQIKSPGSFRKLSTI